jgi:hypothetical protein
MRKAMKVGGELVGGGVKVDNKTSSVYRFDVNAGQGFSDSVNFLIAA